LSAPTEGDKAELISPSAKRWLPTTLNRLIVKWSSAPKAVWQARATNATVADRQRLFFIYSGMIDTAQVKQHASQPKH
jgi:hypothetical protein